MADVFAQLATGAAPDRNLERALKERQAKRDEALRAVGEALLVYLADGGRLEEVEPSERPSQPTQRVLEPDEPIVVDVVEQRDG